MSPTPRLPPRSEGGADGDLSDRYLGLVKESGQVWLPGRQPPPPPRKYKVSGGDWFGMNHTKPANRSSVLRHVTDKKRQLTIVLTLQQQLLLLVPRQAAGRRRRRARPPEMVIPLHLLGRLLLLVLRPQLLVEVLLRVRVGEGEMVGGGT